MNTKLNVFVCQICGNEFQTKANHAKFCPNCRLQAQLERNKTHQHNALMGKTKTVGSEQTCPICGKNYILIKGSQKYCADCQKKQAIKSSVKSVSEYNKQNYERVVFHVPKGSKQKLREFANEQQMSLSAFVCKAIEIYAKEVKNNKN